MWQRLSPTLKKYWAVKAAEVAQLPGASPGRGDGLRPMVQKSEDEAAAADLMTAATAAADMLVPGSPLHCKTLQLLLGGGRLGRGEVRLAP